MASFVNRIKSDIHVLLSQLEEKCTYLENEIGKMERRINTDEPSSSEEQSNRRLRRRRRRRRSSSSSDDDSAGPSNIGGNFTNFPNFPGPFFPTSAGAFNMMARPNNAIIAAMGGGIQNYYSGNNYRRYNECDEHEDCDCDDQSGCDKCKDCDQNSHCSKCSESRGKSDSDSD